MTHLSPEAFAIIEGRHADPFRYLGQHDVDGRTVIRAFLPEASRVEAVGDNGEVAPLARIHDAGLFTGTMSGPQR
ncbi:MAG: 1,4-alpha-glucan branching enzyme, partial [Bradyrhizobium sp.]|nr:1,4-alpha-glucan branching enzyme [Bradyrhizobium sp.]